MAREQGDQRAPAPLADGSAGRGPHDLPGAAAVPQIPGGSESLTTVLVAFSANVLIAVAKSAAAVVTGSASLLAEAAHSWADTGNEIFLLIAHRRARGGGPVVGGRRQQDLLADPHPPVPPAARRLSPVRPRPRGLRVVAAGR